MKKYAVIGHPIKHSLSPFIHQQFARLNNLTISYQRLLSCQSSFTSDISTFFSMGGCGLNITAPFKQRCMALVDTCTERAQQAGAINTLWKDKNNRLNGDNTDGVGFLRALQTSASSTKRILLLGAGGAAHNLLPALLTLSPECLWIDNRSVENAQQLCHQARTLSKAKSEIVNLSNQKKLPENCEPDLIINTIPGAWPNPHFSLLTSVLEQTRNALKQPYCFDLCYQRVGDTPFLKFCRAFNITHYQDGFRMLIAQAAVAFEIWHSVRIDASVCERIYLKRLTPNS